MTAIKDAACEFLANKRVAVTGVSREPKGHGSNVVYKRLRERGYDVFAVNPNADEVEGDHCYHDLRSIPGGVDAAVIATRPEHAEETMRECADLGIRHVWMHRGPGAGSVSDEAAAYGREHGSQSSTAAARACSAPPRISATRRCVSCSPRQAMSPRTSDGRRSRLREVDVQALDAARLEPLIGLERMARYEAVAEAAQAALAGPRRAQRQLDRDRRRRRRDAADAARLRARRGHRRPLARDRGRSRLLRDHQAHPQRALRLARRRRSRSATRERRHYEQSCGDNADELLALVRPGDVVLASRPAAGRACAAADGAPAHGSCGAATSAATSPTSGPSARGSSCARTSRTSRRLRLLARVVRSAVGGDPTERT